MRRAVLLALVTALTVSLATSAMLAAGAPPSNRPGRAVDGYPVAANSTGADVNLVTAYTVFPGQTDPLTALANASGLLLYPTWVLTLVADPAASYAVYVNDLEIAAGSVAGIRTLTFNVTGATASVSVGLGGAVYSFPSEYVLTVPVGSYYSNPPQPLVATLGEVLYAQADVFAAFGLAMGVGFLVAYRTRVAQAKRRVREE